MGFLLFNCKNVVTEKGILRSTRNSEQQTRYFWFRWKASSGDTSVALLSGRWSPPLQKRGKFSGFVATGRNFTCKMFFQTISGAPLLTLVQSFLSRRSINAFARSKAALLLSSFKMLILFALSSNTSQGASSAIIPSCSSLASLTVSKKSSVVPKGNL